MADYYLRFTEDAEGDVRRGTSYHTLGDYEVGQIVSGRFGGMKVVDFGVTNPSVEIGGLCGYMLWAETPEEALEEVASGKYDSLPYGDLKSHNWAIFEGTDPNINNEFGDGDIFTPVRVVHIEKVSA